MYVIMNKYNNTYYKETVDENTNIWTSNVLKAKQFKGAYDAYIYAYNNDMFDTLIVET